MGTCGQPGYVFQDFSLKQGIDFILFCLKQGIDFIIFGLNQGIDFINFCLKQGTFLNSFVIANGLNKKEFRYLHRVWFRVKCLNRVPKIVFVLNRVRV